MTDAPSAGARHCRVCGASTSDGEFCSGCLGSFSAWVSEPPAAPEPAPPVKTPIVDSLWSELMNTPAPPSFEPEPGPKQPVAPQAAHAPAIPKYEPAALAVPPPVVPSPVVPSPAPALASVPVPMPAPARDSAQPPSIEMAPPARTQPSIPVAVQREAPVLEPIKLELEPVKIQVQAPPPTVHAAPARSAAKPAPVSNRPQAEASSRSGGVWMAAAAVVVLTAGLGGYWMKVHGWFSSQQSTPIVAAKQEPPREPVREPQPAPQPAKPVSGAPVETPKPVKPKPSSTPAAGRRPAAAPATARAASAPAPAPIPAAAVSLPVATVALVEAPAAPAVPPPVAPQGPFFEPTDVSEPPRVATRVEPAVPDELRSRARNEIVIVRMLVSPSGHPSRVSVLRRSKAGPRLDEAVIAAVSQWTFSPAKRRGEVVSCWFNMGVPVMAN